MRIAFRRIGKLIASASENVLTAEALQGLDFLPRRSFLGAVVEQAHGAETARSLLASEMEDAQRDPLTVSRITMKSMGATIALWFLLASSALGETLSDAEANRLRTEVAAITTAFEEGDAGPLIERTHPSVQKLAGGPVAFAEMLREAVEQLRQTGVRFLSAEVGAPTQTYPAGDEQVCFVPRVSIMEIQGRKTKSTTFMIAIRRTGGTEWKYIDGAGLRKHPDLLYQLLPELERGISLPPNKIEIL